jgi:hypothetical protein
MARMPLVLLLVACAPQEPAPEGKKMPKHTNRLAKEKSPYLLQHAHNPVDWHPWGTEAFEKAKKENKPIFLSIGYSTCHWCHVMERQSFEDEGVAKVLNERFVPVKVDREERPDVDQIYMAAVTAMNDGRGGWPLSAWLTPELKPFYGGTYYPKESFLKLLDALHDSWTNKRGEIDRFADHVADHLAKRAEPDGPGVVKPDEVLARGRLLIGQSFEPKRGGFSQAPKFPHSTTVQVLLRAWRRSGDADALAMAEKSLVEMARGGIYDQLGGGFHRYSTDADWIVPHFEKMLYDNALLAVACLEAWQATRKDFYARIVRETLDYVLRDMTSKDGGFYSAEDADSEKIEGKFYVWNPTQVREVLGADADAFMKAFDVTDEGNWEPHEPEIPKRQSVLRVLADGDFAAAKAKLLEARAKRVRPGLDDKVLTAWCALMISAMAKAGAALGEARYRDAALRAGKFLLGTHRKDGRLLRTSRLGEAKLDAYLDDHAFLAAACLDLYEATFDASWFDEAKGLAARAVEEFWDGKAGGFYSSAKGHDGLLVRMREEYEGAQPSANGVLALVFLRLHALTGDEAFRERAVKTLSSFKSELDRYPAGQATMMMAVDWLKGPSREIVVSGPDPSGLLRPVREAFLPNAVVAFADGSARIPVIEGRGPVKGKAAAYVCEDRVCKLPVTEPAELEALLKK